MVMTASVSALRLAFNLGYYYHLFKCAPPALIEQFFCAISFEDSFASGVTLALAFSAIGLWSRRVLGFLLSMITFLCLAGIYILWYRGTLAIMEMYGAQAFSQLQGEQQNILPLHGARWWDIVVLAVALIVFIWQVVMLKRVLKPTKTISENQSGS